MTFEELKQKSSSVYPAILLDKISSHVVRKRIRTIFFIFLIFLFVLFLGSPIFNLSFVEKNIFAFRGLFFLVFIFWLIFYLYESMYLSYYFKKTNVSFQVAKIVHNTPDNDVTFGFIASLPGQYTILRLGISNEEVDKFLKDRKDFVHKTEYQIISDDGDDFISLKEYAKGLLHFDMDFKNFLSKKGITPEIFKGAVDWVADSEKKIVNLERWWTRERLMRIPSIGKNWSFGKVFYLEKYGHSIFNEKTYQMLGDKWRVYRNTVDHIEQILVKASGANAILISEDHATGMEIISSFAKEIVNGTTLPQLEPKRLFVLDVTSMIDSMNNKSDFENVLVQIINQASRAGNVILVIPNISGLVEGAISFGSDVKDLLDEALSATNLQVIAVSNRKGFHESIETDRDLMRHFDKVLVENLTDEGTVKLVLDEANYVEAINKIVFTYQAIIEIVKSAKRYFADSIISDKAIDLLHEITPKLVKNGKTFVYKEDVLNLIEEKTGIPQGKIKDEEKDKLRNLEKLLQQRVVGQDNAIESISESLKRARAGLTNPKRPMGSFLFLGPTGVGKTETTKSLAEIYFGDEENIIRVDMSEYNGGDALEKLIGSYKNDKPGLLSSRIKEKQYGVLLLDEFEKTSSEILDLFLQILDEGIFTDGRGDKVNARNLIIIATSNAGSDLIYRATEKGEDVSSKTKEIVDEIIHQGIFRPELINRFDDVVVFHSLKTNELRKIAKLMIEKLNNRLSDKGISVSLNDDLLDYLVKVGNNPKFGAREMNRAIQDNIEKMIADAIIDGNIQSGETIEFTNNNGKLFLNKA